MTHAFKALCKVDIADVLGVSIRTVENWVGEGKVPRPVSLGNRVYWHPVLFFEWLDQHLRGEAERPLSDNLKATTPTSPLGQVPSQKRLPVEAGGAARELAKLNAQAQASVAFETSQISP